LTIILVVAVALLGWYLIDPAGFTAFWSGLFDTLNPAE
jgi:hypothetical protein